jgi:carbonic anhydrase
MDTLHELLDANRQWAEQMRESDPEFFTRLSRQQNPEFLWIGCSDSRVPANQITGLMPGEIFVHRNVANLIPGEDLNSHSVIQYAVDALHVRHVIVCGHYGCGGVLAALRDDPVGLVDYWLTGVRELRDRYDLELSALVQEEQRHDRLCELNVVEQVLNLSRTLVVRRAWQDGRPLVLHGWIYSIKDGLLRDLGMSVSSHREATDAYRAAQQKLVESLSA